MSILIIDNYDSFTFNLFQLISVLKPGEVIVKRNDEIDLRYIRDLKAEAIVLSPGPGHPANDRDFGVCKQVVLSASELKTKILGVCLGHQGIVQHLGGNVVRAPIPVHGKTSALKILIDSPLLKGIPAKGTRVMRYHSLVAEKSSIPVNLEVLAEDEQDGLVMAVQDRKLGLYGLQFHPESIGTPQGQVIVENFLKLC